MILKPFLFRSLLTCFWRFLLIKFIFNEGNWRPCCVIPNFAMRFKLCYEILLFPIRC